jgi:hypothetical protein
MKEKTVLLCSREEIFSFLRGYGDDKPLRRILLCLKRESKEGIAVKITEDYPDPEIESEMQILGFSEPSKATRLDFYSLKQKKADDHLGYSILRPKSPDGRPGQRVGDTIIKTPKTKGRLQHFLTCKAEIPVEEGKAIITYPFFQQHWSERWECGFATLRMFSKWLRYTPESPICVKEEFKDLTFPQIDDLVARDDPSLFTVEDFKKALKKMGLSFLKYEYNNPNLTPTIPPEQIVYTCIESGIPVFVVFRTEEEEGVGHVVTVIGHTFDPDAWWPEAEKDYYSKVFETKYLRSIAWIDFVISDDNYGPFLTMPKDFLKADFDIYQTPWYIEHLPSDQQRRLQEERADKIKNSRIREIIVPFREDVEITVEEAEQIAFKIITRPEFWDVPKSMLKYYKESTLDWRDRFSRHLKNENIVLRTFLVRASNLLSIFPEDKREEIRKIFPFEKISSIPELFWFVEISIPELFAHERCRLGEVIIDPTHSVEEIDREESYLKPLRYIHLPGLQWWSKDGAEWKGELLIDDKPYSHLIR